MGTHSRPFAAELLRRIDGQSSFSTQREVQNQLNDQHVQRKLQDLQQKVLVMERLNCILYEKNGKTQTKKN